MVEHSDLLEADFLEQIVGVVEMARQILALVRIGADRDDSAALIVVALQNFSVRMGAA